MPSFAELIAENLASVADLTWDIRKGRVLAHFALKDVLVEVEFEERASEEWTVSFRVVPESGPKPIYVAFRIFNGVFQALEEFVSVRQPRAVVFVSKEGDLEQIYETYLKREEIRIATAGYRLLPREQAAPFVEYRLERVTPSDWKNYS